MTPEEIKDLQEKLAAANREKEEALQLIEEQNKLIDTQAAKLENAVAGFPVVSVDGQAYELRLKSFTYDGQLLKSEDLKDDSEIVKALVAMNVGWIVAVGVTKKRGK